MNFEKHIDAINNIMQDTGNKLAALDAAIQTAACDRGGTSMQMLIGAVIFAVGCFFGAWLVATGEAIEQRRKGGKDEIQERM